MAVEHTNPETFLVCLFTSAPNSDDERVEVTQHVSCRESLQRARSWYGIQPMSRRAEVWCGPYQLFDSDRVVDFDLALKARCAPEAPGVYGYEWNDDQTDYKFVLIKRGLGR